MASSRKRPRLEENEAPSTSVTATSSSCDVFNFEQLPMEIFFCVFEHLPVREVMVMRTLSSHFRSIIDSAAFVWRKTALRIDLDVASHDLPAFLDFAATKPNLTELRVKCHQTISKTALQQVPAVREPSGKEYTVEVLSLNLNSFGCLNLFAPTCRKLIIKSFSKSTSSEILTSKQRAAVAATKVTAMPHLYTLDISYLSFDSNANKYYIWFATPPENIIFTHARQLLANVRQLHLRFYYDSARKLLECLNGAHNLTLLEFERCNPQNDVGDAEPPLAGNSGAPIQHAYFNSCTAVMTLIFMQHFPRLRSAETLQLMIHEYEDRNAYNAVFTIVQSMEWLKSFTTNVPQRVAFLDALPSLTFKLPSGLAELRLLDEVVNFPVSESLVANLFPKSQLRYSFSNFNAFLLHFIAHIDELSLVRLEIQFIGPCMQVSEATYGELMHTLAKVTKLRIQFFDVHIRCMDHPYPVRQCVFEKFRLVKNSETTLFKDYCAPYIGANKTVRGLSTTKITVTK